MATNAERAEALRTALGNGLRSATVDGITVDYPSASEMLKALAYFESKVAAEAAGVTTSLRAIPLIVTNGHSA